MASTPIEVSDDTAPSGRVARKRAEARRRIVEATDELLRSASMDDITIGDITSAADVGHGSFYLHFDSKEAVLIPIMAHRAAAFDASLQSHLADVDDTAEVLGLSARAFARHILRDDTWRWFLTHSRVPIDEMRRAFGRFGSRDAEAGLAAGRFTVPNHKAASTFGFGGFLAVVVDCLADDEADASELEARIDDAVRILMLTLGLAADDAARIAAVGHPVLDQPETSD